MKDITTLKTLQGKRVVNKDMYIETYLGYLAIDWVDNDYNVHCPETNGGFGRTFTCHADTNVFVKD